MGFIVIALLIGLLPAYIAYRKGHSFLVWYAFGAALFIVALPAALIIGKDRDGMRMRLLRDNRRECPSCYGVIDVRATKCTWCGGEVSPMRNN